MAGVSRSAVSRTFTAGASVAPATREKVTSAAQALGYKVNLVARGMASGRSSLVGLVVSDIDNPFRARILNSLAKGAIAAGYRPFLVPTERGEDVDRHIELMQHYSVAGVIVTGDQAPAPIAERCLARALPLVLINKPDLSPKVANVSLDHRAAGRMAAERLAASGCKRVLMVQQDRSSYSIDTRRDSFIAAAGALGLTILGSVRGKEPNYFGGAEAARAFLSQPIEVDGAWCANDYMALGFMDQLRTSGLGVPGQMKLIACDDIPEAAWLAYDLTTLRQDPETLAQAAIQALMHRIEHPGEPATKFLLPPVLVQRGSA